MKSKGKAMAVTLSDEEISDHESKSDEDGNFFAFTATTVAFTATIVVDESVLVEENLSDGELTEYVDLKRKTCC